MPSFKTEEGKPFTDYPAIGESLIDRRHGDRVLVVESVEPLDRKGRVIRGMMSPCVDSRSAHAPEPYACDLPTLLVMWERR